MKKIGINKKRNEVIFSFKADELVSLCAAFSAAANERLIDYRRCSPSMEKVMLGLADRFNYFTSICWKAFEELKDEQK